MNIRHTDRLTFRLDAHRAGVPPEQIRKLHPHWIAAETVARVVVSDLWHETVVSEEWVVACRLVQQPQGIAVGEIRVYPRAGRTRPGEWTGILLGSRAPAPRGGITTRLLRQVRLDARAWWQSLGPHVTAHGKKHVAHVVDRAGVKTMKREQASRGRPRLPDTEYVRVAREYERLARQPRRRKPLYEALAAKLGLTVGQALTRVATARRRGLLRHVPRRAR